MLRRRLEPRSHGLLRLLFRREVGVSAVIVAHAILVIGGMAERSKAVVLKFR
jgi:hypothetical protein